MTATDSGTFQMWGLQQILVKQGLLLRSTLQQIPNAILWPGWQQQGTLHKIWDSKTSLLYFSAFYLLFFTSVGIAIWGKNIKK